MITNQDVYDLYKKIVDKSANNVCFEFRSKFLILSDSCSDLSLYTKVKRVIDKINSTKSPKNKKIYLKREFQPPTYETNLQRSLNSSVSTKEKELIAQNHDLKQENKALKRKANDIAEIEATSQEYYRELCNMEQTNNRLRISLQSKTTDCNILKAEIKDLNRSYEEKSNKLCLLEKKIENWRNKSKTGTIRNLNKKIKYRDEALHEKQNRIIELEAKLSKASSDLQAKITDLSNSLNKHQVKILSLRDEKKSLQDKLIYSQKCAAKYKNGSLENRIDEIQHLESEVVTLSSKVNGLIKENKDLNDLIAILQDDEIVTFENGRYCNDIREVIMELVSLNVSMAKVNEVIKVVLKKLAKKNVSHVPSVGTKSRFMLEALGIAQLQVAEALSNNKDHNTGNCLHGDGTSKYHRHYQNFQVTTTSGKTLSFGLTEMAGGDAASTLNALTGTLDDICDLLSSDKKDENFANLLCSFKTTMSDLGPVNPLFNSKFKDLRGQLLPKVIENWDKLNEEQKKDFSDMSNFFCKLHLLANFATETDKVLNAFEKIALSSAHENIFVF